MGYALPGEKCAELARPAKDFRAARSVNGPPAGNAFWPFVTLFLADRQVIWFADFLTQSKTSGVTPAHIPR
jgi:hypothetical protein